MPMKINNGPIFAAASGHLHTCYMKIMRDKTQNKKKPRYKIHV